jgi:ribosomal protein L4
MSVEDVDPVSMVNFDSLLVTTAAVRKLEEQLA